MPPNSVGAKIQVKAYLIITGVVFAAVTAAHIWRAFAEGPALAKSPLFILLTLLAAALSFWAWWLLGRSFRSRSGGDPGGNST